jgi:hypothetical protein
MKIARELAAGITVGALLAVALWIGLVLWLIR